MADASRRCEMLILVFGHTADQPPLRLGPMASFKLQGAHLLDDTGRALARHNGHRWSAQGRDYYRVDCAGPVMVSIESARSCGPYEHFSIVNGTVYASRGPFAHYNEPEDVWYLHGGDERATLLLVTPA